MVAVDTTRVRLLVPIEQWQAQLEEVASRTAPVPLDDCLAGLAISSGKQHKESPLQQEWLAHHRAVRDALNLPDIDDLKARTLAHSPGAACLSRRMLDLLGLQWEIAVRYHRNPHDHHFVWDLTNSVRYHFMKDPNGAGVVPCALRRHVYWCTKLGRALTGQELMRVHGFPRGVGIGNFKQDAILRSLAGDTISVAPVGAILSVALASTSIALPGQLLSTSLPELHMPAVWIGPALVRGMDHSCDNLWDLAGQPRPIGKRQRTRAPAIGLRRRLRQRTTASAETAAAPAGGLRRRPIRRRPAADDGDGAVI